MQCPQCGKSGFVTISGKRFCTACGAKLGGSATSATPGSNMSGITVGSKTLDLRAQAPVNSPEAPAPSAGQLHGSQVAGQVLDLRTAPTAPPATAVESAPAAPMPAPSGPLPGSVTQPAPQPVAAPTPIATPAPIAPPPTSIPTPVISKPVVAPPTAPAPPQIKQDTISNAAATIPRSPSISKFTQHPETPAKPVGTLPEAVASQVDAMSTQSSQAQATTRPQSPALQQALAAAKQSAQPSIVKIGAALAAVAVMVAVVWVQNSPKLAFHTAASQAGINASLPTYIPSSYHQSGKVSVSPGQLTLNFTSPSTNSPLTVVQKQSDWDANSLRDNYVSQQTTNYLAVQGEGLTIYLFGNQANWVNHGVWYQLDGTAKLSREQVIKVAYGL